jgi:cyclic dehypoxanthinyl futalosine synthase
MGISRKEALDCLRSNDLIGIGMEADAMRQRLHPEGVVSYAVEGAINCAALSSGTQGSATASFDMLYEAIRETVERGSTGVRLVNGVRSLGSESKACGIEWFEGLLRGIRQRFPSLWIETLSATEILSLANGCGLGLRQTIARLRDAGLSSIASDDAASFDGADSLVVVQVRIAQPRCSPSCCSAEEWLAVHRAAHGLGMRTVATMSFGFDAGKAGVGEIGAGEIGARETLEQRVDFLSAVRQLQEETGGFAAFVPLAAEAASGRELDAVTAVEQLKTLAVARVFLDNIENIQWSGAAQGLKVLQMGLRFGANDAGSVAPSANGAAAANHPSEEDLRRIIRDAGFQPVQRDSSYRTMFLN